MIKSKRHGSIRRAKRKLESEDIILSQGSIQNAVKILGLKRVKVQPKPKLSEAQMQKRIEFAEKKRARNYWRRVLFTDETLLFLEPPSTHVYISSGDSIPQIPRSKQSPKIMVWGGISWYGKTELILVAQGESVDSKRYQKVLSRAWPSIRAQFPGNIRWILQQDGAKCHTSRSTMQWLEDKGAEVLSDWPANSPDLNCLENLWEMFKEQVYRRNFKTLRGLYRVAREEWNQIEHKKIRNLIRSMPERLTQVIERNGETTDY